MGREQEKHSKCQTLIYHTYSNNWQGKEVIDILICGEHFKHLKAMRQKKTLQKRMILLPILDVLLLSQLLLFIISFKSTV